ncbi:hypothetical protein [Streptomyces paromomycinus]|uniref:Uncharacterized protein n=1 Tax=Streptomyces paromomycinus TaxID=92743 RepID=A0A401VUY9_STREY|nr:hypothetical protein [Streptomyces paromomycinus]GCD40890.1 hypothetical protein GKJPGBOP_00543 [Streptomyces paromomycinus]
MTAGVRAETLSASSRFRFRFVSRGRQSDELVVLAVRSLLCCHPGTQVVVVDANDDPSLAKEHFGGSGNIDVVHLAPAADPVARAAGRGTAAHLYYWRHSPGLRDRLPPWRGYDVHADADLLFLRPMDLGALDGPLARGRIAMVVDESTMDHYSALGSVASTPVACLLGAPGVGGPLLQTGLIFSNPTDDGGLYDRLWTFATAAAEAGQLKAVPSDDMGVVSSLLGQRGPLWERFLPLGHEWNYISGALKEPGAFGCVAHFGGRRAKKFLLTQSDVLFPPDADCRRTPWGTMRTPAHSDRPTVVRGLWQRNWLVPDGLSPGPDTKGLEVGLPFSLSWRVPPVAASALVEGAFHAGRSAELFRENADPALFVYLDGRLLDRVPVENSRFRCPVPVGRAETITLIGAGSHAECTLRLTDPFGMS